MKVICVGLGKTGITSLNSALTILGYDVSGYDVQMFEFLDHWYDVFHGTDLDVRRVYGKCDAAIDMPCPVFFEEILKEYPDVKVILSLRGEDAWVKARVDQWIKNKAAIPAIWSYLSPYYRKHQFVDKACLYAALGEATNVENTTILRKRFRIHNDRVRSVVRKENLLEYSVKDGWEPLCEFLGCATPPVAFPHENVKGGDTKKFYTKSKYAMHVDNEVRKVKALLLSGLAACVVLCAAYKLATY